MLRLFSLTIALCAATISSAGCQSVQKKPVPEARQNLRNISLAYLKFTNDTQGPPANKDALLPYLKEFGEPEKILVSATDGEPFVIHWNVDYRAYPMQPDKAPVLAYEKTGKKGVRYVLRVKDIVQMNETQLREAPFPSGYNPPN